MKKRRVLITGGTGLLATNWACAVRDNWNVILGIHQHKVHLDGTNSCKLELDEFVLLGHQLDQIAPDLVVHTAGMTSVDLCEKEPELAMQVNAAIARNIAMATASRNIPLVHISTDHLFSGENSFYKEGDKVEPLNEYGHTKVLAEVWVKAENPDALIIRTNFFAGVIHNGSHLVTGSFIIYVMAKR